MTENENTPEDLEKMITEAEMKAQIEDQKQVSASSSFEAETPPDTGDSAPEKKGLSKTRQVFRRILVWLVLIAFAFAAGFFVDAYLRYQPALAEVAQLTADLEESAATITGLQDEIELLSTYKDKNAALVEEIDLATTHLTILSARVLVSDARLALEQESQADARLALDQLGVTLASLKNQVSPEQADVVETMIQRQQLIILEMSGEGFSALPDLEVLDGRLKTLENTLFIAP
jgi:cell division protein FtsB